jgi:CubicO group peptidase (beta-lactamase class C family)
MKRTGLVVLSILGAPAALSAQDLRARIDGYLMEQVRTNGIPGVTAAVVRDGDVVYIGAFGVRQLGSEDALTPVHIFHFASVSKPFVATAIMQLVERNKLNLDDPVTNFLPYFRLADERFREITVRQMLNHTSGMPDVEDYEWDRPQLDEGAAERYVRQMASEQLLWAPGSAWSYSNMAFDVLGDVIAKVSGTSFEDYVCMNILEPLGMDQSSFIYPNIDEALRTTGHVGDPAKISDVYPYNRRHAPSSTLNSSVSQMTRWLLVNLRRGELDGRRILDAKSYDLLWTSTTESPTVAPIETHRGVRVGLSWFLGEHEGHRTVFHGGGDTGFRSYVLLLPDDGIGIVLASNWEHTDGHAVLRGILDLVLTSDDAPGEAVPCNSYQTPGSQDVLVRLVTRDDARPGQGGRGIRRQGGVGIPCRAYRVGVGPEFGVRPRRIGDCDRGRDAAQPQASDSSGLGCRGGRALSLRRETDRELLRLPRF